MSAFDDCGECGTEGCASFPSACEGISEADWEREIDACDDGETLCRYCLSALDDSVGDFESFDGGVDESGVTLFSDLPLWVYPTWTLRWPAFLGGSIVRRVNRRVNPYFELVMGVK